MFDHTGITVTHFERSKVFYTSALSALGLGISKAPPGERVGFGNLQKTGLELAAETFWITVGIPYVPRTHIAFRARSEEEVVAFYHAALKAGGRDNGLPGLRPQYGAGYYAAYVLDPDGYNIEAVYRY